MTAPLAREAVPEGPNPIAMAGVEFIEYTTPRPQALGQWLESVGFRPVARHRSREVLLYRQGAMNVVVNAHGLAPDSSDEPQIAAIALRVHDAGAAWRHVVDLGAWPVPVSVQPMELHIPGVHGVGGSRIYFVDRWREFSIFDVDFVPIPTVNPQVPAPSGLHWFGVVQYVGFDRQGDWAAFWRDLFSFTVLPDAQHFGILPAGRNLRSPCGSFFLQLIEPEPDIEPENEGALDERWQRMALGTPDVAAVVRAWRQRGVEFALHQALQPAARGALTRARPGGAMFELVQHEPD